MTLLEALRQKPVSYFGLAPPNGLAERLAWGRTPTPIGERCALCARPITDDDTGIVMDCPFGCATKHAAHVQCVERALKWESRANVHARN